MRKYLPIALALAVGIAGTAPALARTIHHRAEHLYNNAPGYSYAPGPRLQYYGNSNIETGTAENRGMNDY